MLELSFNHDWSTVWTKEEKKLVSCFNYAAVSKDFMRKTLYKPFDQSSETQAKGFIKLKQPQIET